MQASRAEKGNSARQARNQPVSYTSGYIESGRNGNLLQSKALNGLYARFRPEIDELTHQKRFVSMATRTPKICLVVDDDRCIRNFVRTVLENEQFETLGANNGTEAFALLQRLGDFVHLVISDIRMPDGNGFEFVAAARSSFPQLPVVLMSGDPEIERSSCADLEIEFLAKPFQAGSLMAAIQKAQTMMAMKKNRMAK